MTRFILRLPHTVKSEPKLLRRVKHFPVLLSIPLMNPPSLNIVCTSESVLFLDAGPVNVYLELSSNIML